MKINNIKSAMWTEATTFGKIITVLSVIALAVIVAAVFWG